MNTSNSEVKPVPNRYESPGFKNNATGIAVKHAVGNASTSSTAIGISNITQ